MGRKHTDWLPERKLSATRAVRNQDVTVRRECVMHVQIYTSPVDPDVSLLLCLLFKL